MVDELTTDQQQAAAAMAMRSRYQSANPALQVSSPAENFGPGAKIGAESLAEAGIRPLLTDRELGQGRALASEPFNLGDEMVASGAALKSAATGGDAGGAYDAELEHARDIARRYEAEHPYESLALSLPGNIAATAAIPAGKFVQAGVGGLIQGIGAGEGLGDRMMKGLINSALGVGTASLFGGGSRYVMRKSVPAESRGADFVQNIADESGVDVNNPPTTTKPLTSAEWLGPGAETHTMAIARREGTTGANLAAEMVGRAAGRGQRVMDDMALSAGIHPDAAQGNIEALVEAGQKQAAPLFDKALAGKGPVWNKDLERLANRPAIARAIDLAEDELRNRDIDPEALGLGGKLVRDEAGRIQRAPAPTAQAWDAIRKSLNRSVERNAFGKVVPDSESPANTAINQASRDLTSALKSAIPGYSDALAVSGDYLSANAAFKRGQDMVLNANVTEDQFDKLVARLGPGDREALKGGIANKLFELAQNNRLRPAQFLTPRAQAKLASALGPNQAEAFVKNLDDEASMAAFERRAVPAAGSQTAPLTQAMKDQDTFGQSQAAQIAQDAMIGHPSFTGIINRGLGSIYSRSSQKVMDALRTSGLSTEARDEAGRLMMLPPSDLATALRTANTGPRGVVGQTAGFINKASPYVSSIPPLLLTHREATQ